MNKRQRKKREKKAALCEYYMQTVTYPVWLACKKKEKELTLETIQAALKRLEDRAGEINDATLSS